MAFYDSVEPTTNQERENRLVNRSLTSLPEPFISGLKLDADIALYRTSDQSELTLNTIDENNAIWVVSDIDGWWNVPQLELPDLPRGWGDGSYDGIGRWTNRLLTLTGSFLVQDPDDAPAARDKLIEYLSPLVKTDGAGYLIVDEGGRRLATKVRLSGPPSIISVNARGRHDFTVGLKAVDPLKYEFVAGDPDGYDSETITTTSGSGSATITNSGNAPVPIIIELSDGFSIPSSSNPPTITNADSDQSITVIGATEANHRLEIDTYNREVLDVTYSGSTVTNVANGRSKASVLIDWIYLNPGTNDIELTNFPTGGTATIYYRSGWIG